MTKEAWLRLHRIYGILLSVSIFLAGICLIAGCLSIYYSGEQSYSPQAVADTFADIALPIYLCLALTIGGLVWELFLPTKPERTKPLNVYPPLMERLLTKKDVIHSDPALLTALTKERKSRRLHAAIRTGLLCVAGGVFLAYALNGAHFQQSDINGSMIQAMWVLLPCLAIPFGYGVFTAYRNQRSLKRELDLIKQLSAAEDANDPVPEHDSTVTILRLTLLILGVGILAYGFLAGGTADVLAKAVNICTECIGLG